MIIVDRHQIDGSRATVYVSHGAGDKLLAVQRWAARWPRIHPPLIRSGPWALDTFTLGELTPSGRILSHATFRHLERSWDR